MIIENPESVLGVGILGAGVLVALGLAGVVLYTAFFRGH
jgi:hypothetical protein